MKKKVFAIIAIAVVMTIAASVMLTGCVGDNNTEQDKISASAEALGMTALGSGAILADMAEGVVAPDDEADTQQPEAGTEIPEAGTETPEAGTETPEAGTGYAGGNLTEEETAVVDRYLQIVDKMLNSSGIVIDEGESELEGYAKKVEISSTDLYGNTQSFVIHYNEQEISRELDDGEEEVEWRLEGIMIAGEREYAVIGERETEADEAELEFTAYLDRDNYVEIEKSSENGEEEFGYKIVVDGKVTEEFELSIEQEYGKTEVEIESVSGGNILVIDFEMKERASGKTVVECKVYENGEVYEFEIDATCDGNREMRRYRYRNGVCYDRYDD
ncbi:MAG: hypothetical protein IAB16_03925 [Firmicutes bacterium]|uniref:Uncharacterized protein n=1 Tax=Candidatus Stercoripulliclostridium pullicola TaxID=2840953 RepID=A0A940DGS9_9FIRM|nr:hypothetical protein [Candidatus Stercoripulliclostridium pullicola]